MSEHTPQGFRAPWNWYWRFDREKNEADCGITSDDGYAIARCPRYMRKEDWAYIAERITLTPHIPELVEALRTLVGAVEGPVGVPQFIPSANNLTLARKALRKYDETSK